MSDRISIGMITPSINRALEPVSYRLADAFPSVSLHFSRVRVTRVGIDPDAMAALDADNFMHSANLLKDAAVDVIMWNGTSGSWMGPEWERALCRRITEETGIPASGSTLALLNALNWLGAKTYSLAVPYDVEHTNKIVEIYRSEGLDCIARDTLDISDGLALPLLPRSVIEDQIRRVAVQGTQAIAIVCTNMQSGLFVDDLERELNLPIVDSVLATFWEALRLCRITPSVTGWGALMSGQRTGRGAASSR